MPGDLFAASPLTVACTLSDGRRKLTFNALVDTGATGYSFIDEVTAQIVCEKFEIAPCELWKPKPLKGFDGRPGRAITHAIYPSMTVHDHTQTVTPMLITSLGNHPIILGKPWMNAHHVMIDMTEDKITFGEKDCCIADALARKTTNPATEPRSRPLLHAPLPYSGNSLRQAPQAPATPLIKPIQILQRLIPRRNQSTGGACATTVLGAVRPSSTVVPSICDSIAVARKSMADPNGKGARSTLEPWQTNALLGPSPPGGCEPPITCRKKEEEGKQRQKRPFYGLPQKRLRTAPTAPTDSPIGLRKSMADEKGTDADSTRRPVRSIAIPAPLTGMPLNKIVKETEEETLDICEVSPVACRMFAKRPGVEVFMIHLHEVEEQLRHDEKEPVSVLDKLPGTHHAFADVFDRQTAENLPPQDPIGRQTDHGAWPPV